LAGLCLLAAALLVVAAAQAAPVGLPATDITVTTRLNTAINAQSLRAHPTLHAGIRAPGVPARQAMLSAASRGILSH